MEIELKARCPANIRARLKKLRAKRIKTVVQKDTLYNSRLRNFEKTDELLRLREEGDGRSKEWILTYKGPKRRSSAKARTETQSEVGPWTSKILQLIGFFPAMRIQKKREEWKLGRAFVCIDDVKGLGKFVEIEVISDSIKDGEKALLSLLKRLGIRYDDTTTASYAEMIHDKRR
jgi:adenylate cyclase class 2